MAEMFENDLFPGVTPDMVDDLACIFKIMIQVLRQVSWFVSRMF